jgi:hypothetical protein
MGYLQHAYLNRYTRHSSHAGSSLYYPVQS